MRKSFILHIDTLCILDVLTDEQAGQLFKKIYEYHNPNKPNETEITQLVNLAFIPFKNQFNRDLDKYSNICERNKNNGKLGGRPKSKNPNKPKKADSDSDSKNDSGSNKEKDKDINIPALSEFLSYALENKPTVLKSDVELKYKSWVENNWADGYGKKIKNWKSKLLNTLPYLKSTEVAKPKFSF